jgi:hypothetical protein
MTTITAAAVTPVGGAFATTPAYSGTFIPTLWSAKLNAKFYAASTFASICNRDWEGEISGMGDKVIIPQIPDMTISDYVVGGTLTYEVPAMTTLELVIDKAKRFGFAISDVLAHQAKLNEMDMFSNDASEQMRTRIDSTCIYNTFYQGSAANRGATAGVKTGGYNLGTDAAAVALTSSNVLQKVLELAAVLDEQNVPDSDRWLLMDPFTRTLLLQSNLAQAQYMGDDKSPVRNGLVGSIDRFKLYITNQLPRNAAGSGTPWTSGDGSESTVTTSGPIDAKRVLVAGHRSAITFASQIVKTETLRNPTDFGDVVRGLQVFGFKVVKPEAMAICIVK